MLLVGLNERWKLPVGYFLVDGITGEQRSNFVTQALSLAHGAGAKVVSITCDGAASNLAMLRALGCSLDYTNLKTSFPHPESAEPVSIFLDACHMLKLVRNAFAHLKSFVDEDGHTVSWSYIERLHTVQQKEGLHAANKLQRAHIHWQRQPMKVRLAAELLSMSVADAINECRSMGIAGFENSAGTERFLRLMNNVFDVLNSRNMYQKYWKKPLCQENIQDVQTMLRIASTYMSKLRTCESGPLLLHTVRKTGFLGFLICCQSAIELYNYLCSQQLITNLPTHRMSQDHLELFLVQSVLTAAGTITRRQDSLQQHTKD